MPQPCHVKSNQVGRVELEKPEGGPKKAAEPEDSAAEGQRCDKTRKGGRLGFKFGVKFLERCRHLLESQSQQSENRPRPLRAEVTELVVVDAVLASGPGGVA